MIRLVHMESGQWVLAWQPYCFLLGEEEMTYRLETLTSQGAGWCSYQPDDLFVAHHVVRVMPKTYVRYAEGGETREHRGYVIASASSEREVLALRDKLFAIGTDADAAIEAETARVMAEFTARTRATALARVHAALPHIFGRSV